MLSGPSHNGIREGTWKRRTHEMRHAWVCAGSEGIQMVPMPETVVTIEGIDRPCRYREMMVEIELGRDAVNTPAFLPSSHQAHGVGTVKV